LDGWVTGVHDRRGRRAAWCRRAALAAVALLGLLAAGAGQGCACALDGVPSLSANGWLAVRNHVVATRATFATWTPFVFARPFAPAEPVVLREDPAKLTAALPPEVRRARWRWAFGDGHRLVAALSATHRYARPGRYRVVVAAYSSRFRGWFPFDAVTLTIGRGRPTAGRRAAARGGPTQTSSLSRTRAASMLAKSSAWRAANHG
jgi:hypothetical protein